MARIAQNTTGDLRGKVQATTKKASDQLLTLLEKRRREDEIRARLAAFAEEMESAREQRKRPR